MTDYAYIINEKIKMGELLSKYGLEPNKKGFICCPFHKEKTASLQIQKNGSLWHCFGCGAGGDVIWFVRKYFELSFLEACKRLDADFSLGLFFKPTLTEYKKRKSELLRKKKKEREYKQKKEKTIDDYFCLLGEWLRLDMQRTCFAPKASDTEISPLYAEAIKNIDIVEHLLEKAEDERREFVGL